MIFFSKRFSPEKLCIAHSLIGIAKYEVAELRIVLGCKNCRARGGFRLHLLTVSSRDLAGRNPSRRIGVPISWLSELIA